MIAFNHDGSVVLFAVACALVVAAYQSQWGEDTDATSPVLISCDPATRGKLLGLDTLCALWLNQSNPLSTPTVETDNETQALVTPVVHSVVLLFLICGECVVLGAALFGSMVHFTPGVGLRASPRVAYASALAIASGAAYHVVCLGWWLGRLELLDVVCLAPACQALLTAAVALLYGAVVDLYNRIDAERHGPPQPQSRQLSPTVALSAHMARFY